jgi:hypothetical protein
VRYGIVMSTRTIMWLGEPPVGLDRTFPLAAVKSVSRTGLQIERR